MNYKNKAILIMLFCVGYLNAFSQGGNGTVTTVPGKTIKSTDYSSGGGSVEQIFPFMVGDTSCSIGYRSGKIQCHYNLREVNVPDKRLIEGLKRAVIGEYQAEQQRLGAEFNNSRRRRY